MSTQSTSRRAVRALTWLLLITAALVALIGGGVIWDKQSWTPKLALDLEGGTEIILAPQIQQGTQLTEDQLAQAVGIIRARVDSAGVSESEVATQGGTNIVVSIPGTPDQATLDRIRSSAKLEFRAVLLTDAVASLEAVGGTAGGTSETPAPTVTPWPEPTAKPTDGSDANWIDD